MQAQMCSPLVPRPDASAIPGAAARTAEAPMRWRSQRALDADARLARLAERRDDFDGIAYVDIRFS